jgi:hypothetical protein
MEFEYVRVCDDVRSPINTVGFVPLIISPVLLIGISIYGVFAFGTRASIAILRSCVKR